jgi:hypothetical protein
MGSILNNFCVPCIKELIYFFHHILSGARLCFLCLGNLVHNLHGAEFRYLCPYNT